MARSATGELEVTAGYLFCLCHHFCGSSIAAVDRCGMLACCRRLPRWASSSTLLGVDVVAYVLPGSSTCNVHIDVFLCLGQKIVQQCNFIRHFLSMWVFSQTGPNFWNHFMKTYPKYSKQQNIRIFAVKLDLYYLIKCLFQEGFEKIRTDGALDLSSQGKKII